MHVKKGDKVKVIAGKDKGKSGVILRALPRENKVVVEGVAIYKRHLRGGAGKVGSIAERPRAIDASNVARVESTKTASALETSAKVEKKAKTTKAKPAKVAKK